MFRKPACTFVFSGRKETRSRYKGPAVYLQPAQHIAGQKTRMDSLSPNLLSAFWGKLSKHLWLSFCIYKNTKPLTSQDYYTKEENILRAYRGLFCIRYSANGYRCSHSLKSWGKYLVLPLLVLGPWWYIIFFLPIFINTLRISIQYFLFNKFIYFMVLFLGRQECIIFYNGNSTF